MSDSLWPHGLQPTRLLRPWDFPGKSTGVGCHCLLRNKAQEALKKKFINACKVQPLHVQQTPLLCQALPLTDEEQRQAGSWPKSHGNGQGSREWCPGLHAFVATWVRCRLNAPWTPLQELGSCTQGCPKWPAAEGPLLCLHPPARGSGEFTCWLSLLPDL